MFVQINTSDEPSKFAPEPDAALAFARDLLTFSSLRVRGLMTLAIFSSDPVAVRACFLRLRLVQERLRQDGTPRDLSDLSMGTSGDCEIAIGAGATTIRVAQTLFGLRPLSDGHDWPG